MSTFDVMLWRMDVFHSTRFTDLETKLLPLNDDFHLWAKLFPLNFNPVLLIREIYGKTKAMVMQSYGMLGKVVGSFSVDTLHHFK